MNVIREREQIPASLRGAFVTIGNFDGIHLGHQYLIRHLVAEAKRADRPAVVVSFDPHPKMVLHPERRPFYLLTTIPEKIRLLESCGVDTFILLPFSLDYAQTTAAEFARDVLWDRLRTSRIIIGHDYTFGRNREGNEAFLKAMGARLGFGVEVMSAFKVGDVTISSTGIRKAILAGEVRFAASLLGRPYNCAGVVIPGNRRGIRLGFPTANIMPDKELLPLRGIYAVHCLIEGTRHRGALNIGFNPTFADGKRSIEVHILDFDEDIYGKTVDVLFVERVRDEIRFSHPDELIAQIGRDIVRVRAILATEE